jgi:hypothetical protein
LPRHDGHPLTKARGDGPNIVENQCAADVRAALAVSILTVPNLRVRAPERLRRFDGAIHAAQEGD